MDKVTTFFKSKQSPQAEKFKEALRVFLLSGVAYVFTEVAVFLDSAEEKGAWIVLLGAFLKLADGLLHEKGILRKGLTRF